MLWRRYRSTLAWGLVLAVVLGSVVGTIIYLGTNPGYREQVGPGLAYWLGLGAVLGGITGVASFAGAAFAILFRDRSFSRSNHPRILSGAVGAAIGAASPWLAFGLVNAAGSPYAASTLFVAIIIAFVSAVVAGMLARLLLIRAQRKWDGEFAAAPLGGQGHE